MSTSIPANDGGWNGFIDGFEYSTYGSPSFAHGAVHQVGRGRGLDGLPGPMGRESLPPCTSSRGFSVQLRVGFG